MYMDYSMKRVKMFSIQFLTAPCCSAQMFTRAKARPKL